MANERHPSRLLLQGSACSNIVGLLSALISICLYCYSLSIKDNQEHCSPRDYDYYHSVCPSEALLIQNIQLEREMALASNRSLAEQNLDMKPCLESQREVLVERYTQLQAIRDTYREHTSIIDGMVGKASPEALFSRMQTEGSKVETESEVLADEFLEGSLPLDSFLDRFLVLRCLAHKRRVRVEKFQEVLRQRKEGNPTAMTSSSGISQPVNQWNPQTTTAGQQQANSKGYRNIPQPVPPSAGVSGGLPYSPYPVTPSNAPPPPVPLMAASSDPVVPPSQVPSYAGSGSPFPPAGGFTGPGSAFKPLPSVACPYPTQSSFPTPYPGSAFGQYNPTQSNTALYPGSYNYGGYSYPSNSQPPTGSPIYRPGYGVSQPYS
ncbi:vacuolar protein sorting-associated protein 37B-like isoform X2 [Nerophis ophidion]|nr:vacuolar protein sorting-associated protein 37B-like isoform X2 [Nerophis ophidion]XP_061736875.1 vacuolar protein sorting-associated protein 37B-like isoform X2 [Nerophis ophidion]